jgi:hypothetical protein
MRRAVREQQAFVSDGRTAMKVNRRRFAIGAAATVAGGYALKRMPASASQMTTLFVYGDTVEGGKNRPEEDKATRSCVLNNIFPRNAQIVWRMRVIDPTTGQPMDDTLVESVIVKLTDDTEVNLKYGGHPPKKNLDFFWSNGWVIPKDYQTGTLDYVVTATAKDGRLGEYKPFGIPSSQLIVTEEVLEDVIEEEE